MPYVRNYTAKVKKCPELEFLKLTNDVFNRKLAFMCKKLFDMKNGRCGEDYKKLFEYIINSPAQFAHGILMPVTTQEEWRSKYPDKPQDKNYNWAIIVSRLKKNGNLLFDSSEQFRGMSGEMRIKIFQMATAKIKSHFELLKLWQEDKTKWEETRSKWVEENPQYMSVKNQFDAFEQQYGKIRGKKRWTLYKEFINNNPEIAPLEKKHLYWNRNFKKFKRRPTYTPPGPRHSEWFQFKKNITYKNLDITEQTIKLQVITGEDTEGIKHEWREYVFYPDTRIKSLEKDANIKGVKMVIKKGKPYLNFAVEYKEKKKTDGLPSQAHIDKYGPVWLRKKISSIIPPEELITMAVDLGIRNIAVSTITKGKTLTATQFIKLTFSTEQGIANQSVTLPHIATHIRERSKKMSESGGRIQKNQSFAADLQQHITAMKLDRAKKSANRIVEFAVSKSAQIIIFEQMQGFVPSDQREKRINKGLMDWNRRKIVEWTKNIAQPYGIIICEVEPKWTSRICNKCGMIGYRYNVQKGKIIKDRGGRLFKCYNCGYKSNADFNASVNLHRVFDGEFKPPKKKSKNEYTLPNGITMNLDKIEEKELGISDDDVFSV